MNRDTLAALPLTVSLSLTLTACGSDGGIVQSPAPAASAPPAASGAPSGDVEDGVLTTGVEYTYVPYNWTQTGDSNDAVPVPNVSGAYVNGYDVMITRRIYDADDQELGVVSVAWDSLIPVLQSGTIDVATASQSMTVGRTAQTDMAGSYYYADIVCLIIAGSAYAAAQGIADLAGGRCTAQSGTIWHDTCLPQIPDVQIQTITETIPTMIMQLQTGAVDFVYTNLPTATTTAANDFDLIVLNFTGIGGDSQFASEEEWAENVNIDMSVVRGSTELLDAISAVLDGMTAGDFDTLIDQATAVQPKA